MMQTYIMGSLHRQIKALLLLEILLTQELELLKKNAPQSAAGLEFSIQELLHQIADERSLTGRCVNAIVPGAPKLGNILHLFSEDDQKSIHALVKAIEQRQQKCSRQAGVNFEVAGALKEQSASLLGFFRKQVMPKVRHTYSNHGKWTSQASTATLISGRM